MRYDAFIAAIMYHTVNNEFYFPSNVKILSWNYDIQFELASHNFFPGLSDEVICKYRLQMYPHSTNYQINTNWFSYIKLNGSCGGEIKEDTGSFVKKWQESIDFLKSPDDSRLRTKILFNYNEREFKNIDTSITFAWEKSPMSAHSDECAHDIAGNTNTLVVIGYSFPSFNRSFDKTLISEMKELKEIIIQVPKESIDEVVLRIKSIRNDLLITPYTGVEEFYIPTTFFPEEVLTIKPEGVL
jgi:hypothetical protein